MVIAVIAIDYWCFGSVFLQLQSGSDASLFEEAVCSKVQDSPIVWNVHS